MFQAVPGDLLNGRGSGPTGFNEVWGRCGRAETSYSVRVCTDV